MKITTFFLTFLIGFFPVLADPIPAMVIENDLKPLVWETIVTKANFLQERQRKEKRLSYAMSAAQLASLSLIACWVLCVWPSPSQVSRDDQYTMQFPKTEKGFFLRTITNGVLGAIGILSVNFFMKIFDKVGGLAQAGGAALATSVGIMHKPVYRVEKYLEIVTELTDSIIVSAKEYATISNQQKIRHLTTMQTNIIVLLDALEIMLARMLLETEVIRKQSRYLARAAMDTIHQTFEITNQSVEIIRQRFEKQEEITDVLERWSTVIKKGGKSFKQYAGMTDTHEENR